MGPIRLAAAFRFFLLGLLGLLGSSALTGCTVPSVFHCAMDEQCIDQGSAGVCESTGYCSFIDPACTANRRYGDMAPAGVAGKCVGEEMLPASEADAADDVPGTPDAAPSPGTPDATSPPLPADAAIPDAMPDADPGEIVLTLGATFTTDTEIDGSAPTANLGGVNQMRVDGSPLRHGLIRFDVSSVPPGAVILAATLRIMTTNEDPLPSGTVRVHRLLETWDESTATFNNRSTGIPWTTPGADAPGSRDPAILAEFFPGDEMEPYLLTLPIAVVSGWVIDPATNAGLILVANMTGDQSAYFYSSEVGMSSRRPSLTVTYTIP